MPTPVHNKDLYKILDLPRNATKDEIRVAYKKMALKWHPDRHLTDKEDANHKFIEIHDAYKALIGRRERRRTHQTSFSKSSTNIGVSHSHSASDIHTSVSSPKPRTRSSVSDRNASSHFPSPHPNGTTPARPRSTNPSYTKGSGCTLKAHDTSQPHQPAPLSPKFSTESPSSCPSSPSSSSSYFQADSSDSHTTPPTSPKPGHSMPPGPFEPLRSDASRSPKSTGAKLRKQSKPRQEQEPSPKRAKVDHSYTQEMSSADDDDFVYIAVAPSRAKWDAKDKEAKFTIKFTLEELFYGTCHRYLLKRHFLSGKRKNIVFNVDIPPGCRSGSKVLFCGVGDELKDGTFQDVAFVIEEAPHQWFRRVKDDLVMDVKVPWSKSLEDEKTGVFFQGLDGKTLDIVIDYPTDKTVNGSCVVPGAGMPMRRRGKIAGRGDLFVRWEIIALPTSKWEALKKVLHF